MQKNDRRDRIKNVDEIPWPAWEFFDVDAYSSNRLVSGIYYGKTVPILATRGCPYQCTYCSSPNMWTTRWYARSPKDVALYRSAKAQFEQRVRLVEQSVGRKFLTCDGQKKTRFWSGR